MLSATPEVRGSRDQNFLHYVSLEMQIVPSDAPRSRRHLMKVLKRVDALAVKPLHHFCGLSGCVFGTFEIGSPNDFAFAHARIIYLHGAMRWPPGQGVIVHAVGKNARGMVGADNCLFQIATALHRAITLVAINTACADNREPLTNAAGLGNGRPDSFRGHANCFFTSIIIFFICSFLWFVVELPDSMLQNKYIDGIYSV